MNEKEKLVGLFHAKLAEICIRNSLPGSVRAEISNVIEEGEADFPEEFAAIDFDTEYRDWKKRWMPKLE